MNDTTDCSVFFTRNTDLSGIGVRTAFYISVIMLPLQIIFAPGEYILNCWTLTTMNVGLLIATMVDISNRQMSFFNAVIVVNLLGLALIAQIAIFGEITQTVRRMRKSLKILPVIFVVMTLLISIFAVYLWVNAAHFGLQPECIPEIKFYLFVPVNLSFRVIRSLAIAWYAIFIFVSGVAVVLAVYALISGTALNDKNSTANPAGFNALSTIREVATRTGMRWWSFAWLFVNMIVEIPTLELFLRQNPQPDDSQGEWSYGQILSLISVIPTIVSVMIAVSSATRRDPWELELEHQRAAAAYASAEPAPHSS